MKKRVETAVCNGDCMTACLAAAFECMSIGYVKRVSMVAAAARLRHDLVEWIKEHWLLPCVFYQGMCFHEIFQLAHDVGIPEQEQERAGGPWPEDPKERLERYLRNKVYMCEAEQMAFVCMMHERGINFCLRNWRASAADESVGFLVSTVPDAQQLRQAGIDTMVVVDIQLTGTLDSRQAHYKLLNSASLEGLARAEAKTPAKEYSSSEDTALLSKKRRRIIDLDDSENSDH